MLGRVCTRGRVCTSGNFDRLLDLIYYIYLNLKGDIGLFDISMQIRSTGTLWYIRNIVTFLNCPIFYHKRHSKIFDKFRKGKVPRRSECVTCRSMADAELLDNNNVTGKKNPGLQLIFICLFCKTVHHKIEVSHNCWKFNTFYKRNITYMHLQSITLQYRTCSPKQ